VQISRFVRLILILMVVAATIGAVSVIAGRSRSNPVPTPTPTKTPRPAVEVAAATSTPVMPLATETPIPTPTAEPTVAPTATETPILTETPSEVRGVRSADVNPLTGLMVEDPANLTRRPLFVVINNDPPARAAHYGFSEADLVYEYVMEGLAVTRYTAVFLGRESERIGPVRSARLINLYLTPQYGGALAASGAGDDVRWWLKNKMPAPYLDIDLDDPGNNVYSFSLGSDYRTRMQTSTAKLRQWLTDWGVDQDPQLSGFAFSETAPAGAPAGSANIDYPASVSWAYDPGSGRYLRTIAGAPHMDANSGQQLSATNVIIATMPHEPTDYVEDSLGTTSIRIVTVGEGAVMILRDGVAMQGTWRGGDTTMPQFFDATGEEIPLKPGNSWFEIVAPERSWSVSP
jgi:hypothetical protein